MPSFWEDIRKRVVQHTTSADVASMIYQKLASTGVQGPAIIKPSFYLGQISVLTMDFMDHVEQLQEIDDRDWAGYLRSVGFLRECARSIVTNIERSSEPLERLITIVEEILEGEEFAALEDEDELEAAAVKAEEVEAADTADDVEVEDADVAREEMSAEREALEETLRSKFRNAGFGDETGDQLAKSIGNLYLECVQLAKELSRLSKAPDEDTATAMSILIDLQYGVDSQLRSLLVEDVNVADAEPTFNLGFFTWSALLLSELMDKVGGEKPALVAAT